MTVSRRGKKGIYKYEFMLFGKLNRGSCKTTNHELAKQIEQQKKDELNRKVRRIPERKGHPLFSVAYEEWIKDQMDLHRWDFTEKRTTYRVKTNPTNPDPYAHLDCPTYRMHRNSYRHLKPFFGGKLITEIDDQDLINYQKKRLKEGASKRSVDIETGTLGQVLRKHRLWLHVTYESDFEKLVKVSDIQANPIGKCLSEDEINRVLAACRQSSSRSIYAAVLASINTGLRNKELRTLQWWRVNFESGTLHVGKSKTAASSDRFVSINPILLEVLKQRHAELLDVKEDDYIFPSQIYGMCKRTRRMIVLKTFLDRPISNLNRSWYAALAKAGVKCRWHDMRHTCATRMAEQGAPDDVLLAHFGWMSKKMIRHYAHIRNQFGKHWNDKAFNWLNVEGIVHLGVESTPTLTTTSTAVVLQ